ncbi:MAG: polysaccharide biosynthesis/export family protein [bacterium]
MKRLLILLVGLGLVGCGSSEVDPAYEALVEQQSQAPPTGELGVGDRFELSVHGQPDLSGMFTVSDDGTINFPYVGRVKVDGVTCASVEKTLTEGLSDGYLKNPSVRCSITEYNSKRIYLFGEVNSPGSFPYKSNITIIEGIALAGGFSANANSNGTKLSRVVNSAEIQVRVPMQDIVEGKSKNIKLLPGDIVYVPELPY